MSRAWVPNRGRVQEIPEEHPLKPLSLSVARQELEKSGVQAGRVRTWLNLQPPDPGDGYSKGYPHVHQNPAGTTLVLYLSENPSPLDILSGGPDTGTVLETLAPQAGDVIEIPNGIWHGAHRNQGPDDRVAMIVTGYP